MNPTLTPRRSFWPHALIGWFILFTASMASWIAVAVRNDMDLVRKDYYEEEIRYQGQIDRLHRTQPWRGEVRIAYDPAGRSISIALPAAHARGAAGHIQLYRPSDAKLDRQVNLSPDESGHQTIDARPLRAGLWKVRVQWKVDGQDYYFDQPVVVTGT